MIEFPAGELMAIGMPEREARFLAEAGIPPRCAPYLKFEFDEVSLPILADWPDWDAESSRLGRGREEELRVLAEDGGGNPLVLDEASNWELAWLDARDGYRREYANSGLIPFFRSILAVREFVADVQRIYGKSGFVSANFSQWMFGALKSQLREADPRSLTAGAFWARAFENLPER